MSSSPKLFHARPSFFTRRSTPLIVFTSLAIGLTGFLFGLSTILFPGLRLSGRSCLTNLPPKTVKIVWDVAGNSIVNGEVKRHKVMGFVGIQTGFRSAGRRRALRNTWMPSDPEGLRRYWFNLLSTVRSISAIALGFSGINLSQSNELLHHLKTEFSNRLSTLTEKTIVLCRLEESTGLAIRFIIGKTKDEAKMVELRSEVAMYDDFILLDIEEEYSKLPYKTLV